MESTEITAKETFVPEKVVMRLPTRVLAEKIVDFGERLAGIKLYNYQRTFALCIVTATLVRDGREPTALYSRQSGKSEVVAVVSLALAILLPCLAQAFPDDERVGPYTRGFRVGCYGPKLDKAAIVYRRIRKYGESDRAQDIYRDPDINIIVTQSRGNAIGWSNGSIVAAQTASDTVDNEGETWHLVIIDEAQKVSKRKIEKEIRPMLASTNGPLVMIGTASMASAYFRRNIEDNIKHEEETNQRLHFEYPYDKVVQERRALFDKEARGFQRFEKMSPKEQAVALDKNPMAGKRPDQFHLQYEKYVQREIAKIRGDLEDPAFKMNFRLCWKESSSSAIDEEVFYGLAVPNLELNDMGVQGHVVAGLDIAKGMNEHSDETILTIMHVDTDSPMAVSGAGAEDTIYLYNKTIVGLFAFRGMFEADGQYSQISDVLMRYPVCYMLCDSTGMGDPVTERLQVLLPHIKIEGMKFTPTKKSQGYKKYLTEINSRRLYYPAGEETLEMIEFEHFVAQHLGLRRTIRHGVDTCEAEPGDHDDYPDSAMLCNLAVEYSMDVAKPMATVESSLFSGVSYTSQHGDGPRARAERYRRGRSVRRR